MTRAETDVVELALRVGQAIERVGGAYFVGGSLASSVHGEPRATNDIDLVLDLPLGKVRALCEALGDDFEVDEAMLRQALMSGGSANAFYLPTVTKVDFFGHAHDDFGEAEFDRRKAIDIRNDGRLLYVKSAEDTVLRKLEWYELGGRVSDRQWRDIVGVLRMRRTPLEDAYLDQWARVLGVTELLDKVRAEAASRAG